MTWSKMLFANVVLLSASSASCICVKTVSSLLTPSAIGAVSPASVVNAVDAHEPRFTRTHALLPSAFHCTIVHALVVIAVGTVLIVESNAAWMTVGVDRSPIHPIHPPPVVERIESFVRELSALFVVIVVMLTSAQPEYADAV